MAKVSWGINQGNLVKHIEAQKAFYNKTDADLCTFMMVGQNAMTKFKKHPGEIKLFGLQMLCKHLNMKVTIHKDGKLEVEI